MLRIYGVEDPYVWRDDSQINLIEEVKRAERVKIRNVGGAKKLVSVKTLLSSLLPKPRLLT